MRHNKLGVSLLLLLFKLGVSVEIRLLWLQEGMETLSNANLKTVLILPGHISPHGIMLAAAAVVAALHPHPVTLYAGCATGQ